MSDEYCFECSEPTGRAGKYEDSLYCDECPIEDGQTQGPFCEECFDLHSAKHRRVEESIGKYPPPEWLYEIKDSP